MVVIFGIALAMASGVWAGEPTTTTVVLKTKWTEVQAFGGGTNGALRLYVRKIELTRTTWKAWVGLTNSSAIAVTLTSALQRPNPRTPFVYWAGPGIWWSTYVAGSHWYPGSGTVLTHSTRAAVQPAYPTTLPARKSWFGTFSGSVLHVPKSHLLRIGFGTLVLPGDIMTGTGEIAQRKIPVSTTHEFKLARAQ